MRFILFFVTIFYFVSCKEATPEKGTASGDRASTAANAADGASNATKQAKDSTYADPTKDPNNNIYYVAEDKVLAIYPDKNIKQISADLMKIQGIIAVSFTDDGKLLAVKGDPNKFNEITKIFFK
jgi:hypothetical protein